MEDEGDELDTDDSPEDGSGTDAPDSGVLDVDEAIDAETTPIRRLPANAGRRRRWSNDDDTAVLPRLQDVRPPSRATPIRRPPWLR